MYGGVIHGVLVPQGDHTYCKICSRAAGMPQILNTKLQIVAQHSAPMPCTKTVPASDHHFPFEHHQKQTRFHQI